MNSWMLYSIYFIRFTKFLLYTVVLTLTNLYWEKPQISWSTLGSSSILRWGHVDDFSQGWAKSPWGALGTFHKAFHAYMVARYSRFSLPNCFCQFVKLCWMLSCSHWLVNFAGSCLISSNLHRGGVRWKALFWASCPWNDWRNRLQKCNGQSDAFRAAGFRASGQKRFGCSMSHSIAANWVACEWWVKTLYPKTLKAFNLDNIKGNLEFWLIRTADFWQWNCRQLTTCVFSNSCSNTSICRLTPTIHWPTTSCVRSIEMTAGWGDSVMCWSFGIFWGICTLAIGCGSGKGKTRRFTRFWLQNMFVPNIR